jgi:hypothetical protein
VALACLAWNFITDHATVLSAVISMLAAVVVAVFTSVLVHIGRSADRNFRTVERAYVKVSHYAPGIYWIVPKAWDRRAERNNQVPRRIRVDLRVKNFGQTPAHISGMCMVFRMTEAGEKLPEVPDYSDADPDHAASAFLVTEDEFTYPLECNTTKGQMADVLAEKRWLYVYGYVEYLDKFSRRHRGGYARRYARNRDEVAPITIETGASLLRDALAGHNNLIFVDQRSYDYDITQMSDGTWPKT